MLRSDKNAADFSSAAFFIPSIILFAAQQELHVREGPLLPDVPHHLEQLFQQRSRLGVEQIVVFAVLVILPRGGVGVLAAQIDLAGGHTVAHKNIKTKDVIPGSIIATLAWFLISFFYSYYTNNYSNYEVIYGSIGGIIVLITWLYLSSWSILIGLEVNVRLYFRKLKRQKGSV